MNFRPIPPVPSQLATILLLMIPALGLSPASVADQALITIDDDFEDWIPVPLAYADPGGDSGAGEIDFARVWIADDPRFLFVRIELGLEIDSSENNDLRLYLDTDANSNTGLQVAGIGAELEWRFGSRNGTFHVAGQTTVFHDDLRFRAAPAVTDDEIEIAIGRDAVPDGSNPLFVGPEVRIAFVDAAGSDQVPDAGDTITYTLDRGQLPPDPPLSVDRQDPGDLRMITYNVLNDSPWDPGMEPLFGRQLAAVEPDILSFQEIRNHSAAETATLVSSWVPLGPGESWHSVGNSDCKTVSRYPILGSWPLDGNLAVLIDTTTVLGTELLLINAHLPCCSNDSGRQSECDRIMAFIRDAKAPGGVLTLLPDTPIVITGDLNLVGLAQQLTTLLSGDIVNGGFGADFDPDWDGSPLTNVISRQTEKRMGYTWRNDSSSFWPGHLDYHIYSDAVLELRNHFLLYTPEIANPGALGLQAQDSTASDHLLFCADFTTSSLPELTTNPPDGGTLDLGTVRVGEETQAALRATNTGGNGTVLSGTFPAASGDFSPASSLAFGPVAAGGMVERVYSYSPAGRGSDSLSVTVTSDAGDSMITLAGTGVGPMFASNPAPGSMIRFNPQSGLASTILVSNVTADGDGGVPARTALTLRSVTITGPARSRFIVEGFTPGTVLAPGESVTLRVVDQEVRDRVGTGVTDLRSGRPPRLGRREATVVATLTVHTDEGVAVGGEGSMYPFMLRATSRSR